MRNVDAHLLEEKMDEAVTHYINTHQAAESVHVDANSLALNVQVDTGRVVTVMHGQSYAQMRQVSVTEQVGEGPWTEELLDSDERLDALVAHLHSRASHHQVATHHKVPAVRGDVDTSVILDAPIRLFNGQTLESHGDSLVVDVPQLPPMPPLLKRNQSTDWFSNRTRSSLKEDALLSEAEGAVLELSAGASPHSLQHKQSRKSLPHKKRISRRLKRPAAIASPHQHQDLVVVNCTEDAPHEEILPDNFVSAVQHQDHLPEDTHHIAHEMRAILICQLCGEFYGEEQLKFFHHLKQHYEPHTTIIIENPVSDLAIDKMTNTCIVDNVATLPDSLVELSLESTVPKSVYQQHADKHPLYTSAEKTLYCSKVQYSIANIDKEPTTTDATTDKTLIYDSLDKLELTNCGKTNKYRRQSHSEQNQKQSENNKLEDMGEFSEPEDLMAGIHVAVEEAGRGSPPLLPRLTVECGHVHQDHLRHWYMRNGGGDVSLPNCGGDTYCPVCPAPRDPSHSHHKEEVQRIQRILETEVPTSQNFTESIITEEELPQTLPEPEKETEREVKVSAKKKAKKFECLQCGKVFNHRNSLMYHVLSHSGRQHNCKECGKGFYTVGALKIHKRVHNGDKPYKCEVCDRDFRQWSDLKYHKISLHSNQKHFKCEFCGKEFARKYSLSVHRRIHTGEKNYKCEYCNKTFRASCYRLSHMRTHTGDRPYKCTQCDKCFRVAGDLRRHLLTHEKLQTRLQARTVKVKNEMAEEQEIKTETSPKVKKIAVASTTRPAILRQDSKKTKTTKKNQIKKVGAPNVTVTTKSDQFKVDYPSNVEVFDTRQEYSKFKEDFNETDVYNKDQISQYKADEQMVSDNYKDQRLEERDLAMLRPILRTSVDNQRGLLNEGTLNREGNTDGKMPVFQHTVNLSDIRALERERAELHGEHLENGFLERLTAFYNIPAV